MKNCHFQFHIFVFFLAFFQVKATVSSPSLTITPRHAYIEQGQTASVMCKLDGQLIACQFHLNDNPYSLSSGRGANPLMDFNSGVGATTPGNTTWYYGAGLEAGECGIQIPYSSLRNMGDVFVLGCRVLAEKGGWKYADMTLYALHQVSANLHSQTTRKPYDLVETDYPYQVIVEKDEQLKIAYKLKSITDESQNCTFMLPGVTSTWVNPKMDNDANTSPYRYLFSTCGIEIRKVRDENNGWMWGRLKSEVYLDVPFPKTTIIVAKSPENADIDFSSGISSVTGWAPTRTFDEGDSLNAACYVNSSRPVSNITWFFGDDVIRDDDNDDSPVSAKDKWRWDYDERPIMQNISRKLSWMDDGKWLLCHVSHLAFYPGQRGSDHYDNGWNRSMLIVVNHAKRQIAPTELLFEDIVIGRPGVLVVDTGFWNISRPTFVWRVMDDVIRENEFGKYHFHHVPNAVKENGNWIATLVILHVGLEDMEKQYLLIAGDESDRREYLITITTVDMKLWYFFITLFSGVTVVLLVLGLIYYKDIRHWFTHIRRQST